MLCDPNALGCVDCCQLKGFTQHQKEGHWGGQEEWIPAEAQEILAVRRTNALFLPSKKPEEHIVKLPAQWTLHSRVHKDYLHVSKDPQGFQYTLLTKFCWAAPENGSPIFEEHTRVFMFSQVFYKSLSIQTWLLGEKDNSSQVCIHWSLSKITLSLIIMAQNLGCQCWYWSVDKKSNNAISASSHQHITSTNCLIISWLFFD